MPEIYIDGQAGTTGLEIVKRLSQRDDIHLILIDEDKRKDEAERRRCMNAADLVFLCLPDEAAIEAVKLIEDPRTKVIDASTAHRCDPQWAYGFIRGWPIPAVMRPASSPSSIRSSSAASFRQRRQSRHTR